MKSFKKFQFFYLFIAAMMLLCLSLGQAAALTADEQAEIQLAVETGDPAAIKAVTKRIVADAIVNGEDPADIAEQVTSIAVTAAAGLDAAIILAVTEAACSGAAVGAVEAAVATGQDVAAVAQAACSGATLGAIQAAAAMPDQDSAFVAEITDAASNGAIAGAIEGATNTNQNVAEITQAAQTGSSQGANQAQQQIAGITPPEEPEAFEPADETTPPEEPEAFEPANETTPPPTPPPVVVETPPTQDIRAASPI